MMSMNYLTNEEDTKMDKIILIIPTLEPDKEFINILKKYKNIFKNIVVVNDGSDSKYNEIFESAKDTGAVVLKHALNYGKGRALKTAFDFILNNYKEVEGVITVDSDGQHLPSDAKRCAEAFMKSKNKLILGARNFEQANIPFKSRIGNKLTRNILNILCGINLKDSQTGLRVIGIENVKKFIYTSGERFEYETNMLLDAKKYNVDLEEVDINTIYLDCNNGTHFNPLRDSFQIYKVFIKYIIVSMSSFVIDLLGFTILLNILSNFDSLTYKVIISNVLARVISSNYNYLLNKNVVFNKDNSKSPIVKYYILAVVQICIATILVGTISKLFNNNFIVIIKIIVDAIIFIVNYYIQREWVFKSKLL